MLSVQKQLIEALERTLDFLLKHRPAEATPAWDALVRDFRTLVENANASAAAQLTGQRLERAGTASIRSAVRTLRWEHLKPIMKIAHANRREVPGIMKGLHLPARRLPITKLIAESHAIREIATSHKALMVSMGRPGYFIERLDAAIEHLHQCVRDRERAKSMHVGATAALEDLIRRARNMVEVFDCQMEIYLKEDAEALGAWQAMKKVHARPGPAIGIASSEDATEAPAEQSAAADSQVLPIVVPKAA